MERRFNPRSPERTVAEIGRLQRPSAVKSAAQVLPAVANWESGLRQLHPLDRATFTSEMRMAIVRSMLPSALQAKVDILRPKTYVGLKRELERLIDLEHDPMDIGALEDGEDYEELYGVGKGLKGGWDKGRGRGKGK